jgi:Zn-dependent peptidase ImmA (M78 family)/DNA-binding XRE family transcriptional regulator
MNFKEKNMTILNHRLLQIARQSRYYTQNELAKLLNINQSTFSKIEKGLFPVNDILLEKIVKILNYPVEFFCQEEIKTPLSNIYFRKRVSIKQKSLDKIFADVKIILQSIDILLSEIEIKEYNKYAFDLTDGWTPNSIAIRLREIFKIPSGPIKNIVNKIEEQGIIVYFYDCAETKFDGLTSYTNSGHPVIFVNKNLPNDRIKYSIAHELFHLTAHIPCDIEPWRDFEKEANEGAAAFLMPEKDCINDLTKITYSNLSLLKAYWGVSKAVIIRRAKDLGKISESTYTYLMIELGRRNERKIENGFVEIDSPQIIKVSTDLIKKELNYSDEYLAASMNLHEQDYQTIFNTNPIIKLKSLKIA